ncbi:LysR family transcriptional regulator [Ochrobactrum sp. 30A/1000/2015]|uniref:Probable cat1 operon transcriptional activator n=2 Tax=Brucella/Ochrobactrum group TaxID=2826938 RepID=C4WNV4_9HYPH|nr:Probable cat1 operon transcriptional activator [Brucella intermedia LMG 3301]PJT20529.1 LysR family transcriptional regulator [Ochrobactrum sp. 30A/1000/2015]PJT36668.1 LysR family transcriptional regulator [Ochrobactrum sp. 27A/999/2015]PJT41355.1 LysR family transcriptional regulator [Ochrobactrum sp. 23A/997/2015]
MDGGETMELRHLRYFLAVADALNFTTAAQRLGISQPPLSHQIKLLEIELGVDLFERSSRRVTLTKAGEVFRRRALSILEQVKMASEHARSIGQGNSGVLNIGLTGSILIGHFAHIMNTFCAQYPDVEVRTHEMSPGEQIIALKAGRTELSILRSPPEDSDLTLELAWPEKIVVVLSADHRLAHHESIRLEWLNNEKYVSLRLADSRFANYLLNACIANGFVPSITQQVVESYSLLSLVAAGFGVALAPESVSQLSRPNVIYRTLQHPPLVADVYAVSLSTDNPVTQNFLNVLLHQTNHLLPERLECAKK